jgi:hypothetical protein
MIPIWGPDTPLPKLIADMKILFQKGLTFKDNINAAIVTVDCKHNTETLVANPLQMTPIAFIPMSSMAITAIGGQSSQVARPIDGVPVLNTSRTDGYLGLTVKFSTTVGEALSASVVSASATSITNASPRTITSLPLTPGNWDVSGVVAIEGTLTGSYSIGAIATSTDARGTPGHSEVAINLVPGTGSTYLALGIPPVPFTVTTSQTVYLTATCAFSAGTATAYGRITARRWSIDTATLGRVTGILVGA